MAAEQFEITMMMQLVDQNRISLSDPASTWFPGYPHAGSATLRMLAASSSGFGDYVYGPADPAKNVPSFADLLESNPYQTFTSDELIARSQAPYQSPAFTDPGGDFQYSHTNYVAIGSILEKVTGEDYGSLLQSTILRPLKLADTEYTTAPAIQQPVLHAFTSERGSYEESTGWSPSWTSFSGAINSNVCDLAAWEQSFGTHALVSPESAAAITAPTNVGHGMNTPSLYFGLGTILNGPWVFASGNFFGWHTATAFHRPSQTALVITVTEGPSTTNAGKITTAILKQMSAVLTPKSPLTIP